MQQQQHQQTNKQRTYKVHDTQNESTRKCVHMLGFYHSVEREKHHHATHMLDEKKSVSKKRIYFDIAHLWHKRDKKIPQEITSDYH
jgi:FAD synthase